MPRQSSTRDTVLPDSPQGQEHEHEWEWIYNTDAATQSGRARRDTVRHIIGARHGLLQCRVGDCVLLRAEASNHPWVAIITAFVESDDEGDMAADFLWFSSNAEIRNGPRKRHDFLPNELYITASTDINPLSSIDGKARVMSHSAFLREFPTAKVPRSSSAHLKTFVCRRGCNARTTTYTPEFTWEDEFSGALEDIANLLRLVHRGTQSTRRQLKPNASPSRLTAHSTPRKRRRGAHGDGDEGHDDQQDDCYPSSDPDTPSKTRTPRRTQKTTRLATPSSRSKIVVKKALEFTPLATRMLSPSHNQASPFQIARAQLHVASVPSMLPCRESEFAVVYSHLEAAITDGSGACIYISGTPGTGKTATVREVIARLDEAVHADELDDFLFVEINGMKITDPHQSYCLLWEALRGQRVSPSQALDLLEREFSHPSPRRVPCVVLMDELDQLVTKNQSVMYNFFNWPGLRHSRLIVLAVANTMDLPERTLSNKISSRLGLTRITFPGYNHEQLMKIIQSRLEGVPGQIVEPDAVQFASRKVAAVSGDARRALDICRRAVELAETDSKTVSGDPATPSKRARADVNKPKDSRGVVTIGTVKRAISEATTSPLQQYLRGLPFAYKAMLAALLLRSERSGLPDTTYSDVLEEIRRALVLDAGSRRADVLLRVSQRDAVRQVEIRSQASHPSRTAGVHAAAVALAGAGVIILEGQRPERPSKMRLAVGDEEVKLALRDDPEIKALGIAF
ncbi:ATPase [Xylariaceae sp. FL1019]|nr:ATPase [Xylariaceae sp. FL1019]